ncbi:hypothetical protein SARC_02580 [Sphaeroforma arctica JP610]|uniref:C2 domain-containing protein n=1 Tax=Sphaeroforma arctica JP610 TaxID=667725 RepID=A0A0L0G8B8_9EUKA|nr:hypothetical protein SARC_02580 [Sphaeroforma arctica JP610]KNC85245.1 hypothetical protein SARC_02580 [Sphaeroforma arctica JP610]|eukprot:XP_014159147.1 hypothetical protein SARC_02580 [Sphaeroforma arctica JP610]
MDGLITFHIIEAELPEGCKANCRLELNGKNVSKSRASPESDKPKFNYHTSVLVEPEDKLVLQIQKKKLLGHGLVGEAVVPKLEEKEEMEGKERSTVNHVHPKHCRPLVVRYL